ncbi:probable E3 ubiquitin-protein ligase LUL4 [Hibiscus syriacus]|uniref:probable E3 ubiquitin-protein ligase LUL4 n=1 Tax=Hibiscus syriacus TaxID=106335 RepID=UPI001923C239|nr:probable E3 ubiquitin-protein ligase LUL4 [Hibiscus syriacus]
MGHSLSKLRRFHHQNQTHLPSLNNPTSFNGSSTQNISIPSSSPSSSSSSSSPDVNAPRPSASMMSPPPPYVDHTTAKKIKNDINIHKDSISLFLDHTHWDSHLISFTFDALVDGSITIFYFAKEGPNCNFMPMYPEIYMPKTIPFHKGLAQKFYQPSGTGIDIGFFAFDLLSRPSKEEDDIFPLVLYAEACLPTLMGTADIGQPPPFSISPHAQITEAALKLNNEGHFEVKVIKQILWIEGIRYELRDIYGFENCNEQGLDDDSETFGTCVICMTEPKDTAVLPCRHMCICSDCAKQLRLKSKRCPVCRHLIQELIEIKIENQTNQSRFRRIAE